MLFCFSILDARLLADALANLSNVNNITCRVAGSRTVILAHSGCSFFCSCVHSSVFKLWFCMRLISALCDAANLLQNLDKFSMRFFSSSSSSSFLQ